jgi:hypothetical protein
LRGRISKGPASRRGGPPGCFGSKSHANPSPQVTPRWKADRAA